MDYLYTIYNNVVKMITEPEYRNLTLLDNRLSTKEFENLIQNDKYIRMQAKDTANVTTIFYLLHYDSDIVRKFQEFKKILNKVPKDVKQIYFISNKGFSSQNYRMVTSLRKKLNINLISHEIFALESPKHVLVSKHRILNKNEVSELFENLSLLTELMLPKILDSDPQCVWIGAKPLDILHISRNNINGESITYRLVVGTTSKKITSELQTKERRGPHGAKVFIPKEVIEKMMKNPKLKQGGFNIVGRKKQEQITASS